MAMATKEPEPVPGTQVGTDRDGEPEYLCAVGEDCGHVSTEKFGRFAETEDGPRWYCFIHVDKAEEDQP